MESAEEESVLRERRRAGALDADALDADACGLAHRLCAELPGDVWPVRVELIVA